MDPWQVMVGWQVWLGYSCNLETGWLETGLVTGVWKPVYIAA